MTNTIKITFPDGNTKNVNKAISGLEIAESISKSLAKAALAAKVNGEMYDLNRPLEGDAEGVQGKPVEAGSEVGEATRLGHTPKPDAPLPEIKNARIEGELGRPVVNDSEGSEQVSGAAVFVGRFEAGPDGDNKPDEESGDDGEHDRSRVFRDSGGNPLHLAAGADQRPDMLDRMYVLELDDTGPRDRSAALRTLGRIEEAADAARRAMEGMGRREARF